VKDKVLKVSIILLRLLLVCYKSTEIIVLKILHVVLF